MRKLSLHDIKTRLAAVHGTTVTIDESAFTSLRTKCRFIDNDYGEWWTDPWSVLTGRGHPHRGRASMGAKQTVSQDEMLKRLIVACGDVVSLGDDYTGLSTKCTFIDKDHGPWRQLPQRVLNGTVHPKRRAEKAAKTCMARYGVHHTNHLPEVMRKINAKRSRWMTRRHWHTGEELTCMSSYEVAFVEWCRKNHVDFEWQVKHLMPDGRAYFVDARIIDGKYADTWVEIKGWLRPEGRRKWEWFKSTHHNSALWTRDVLISVGILQGSRKSPASTQPNC